MDSIVIGFSKRKGFAPLGWLIQLVQGTPFSHVYIKLHSSLHQRYFVYHASGTTVNMMGYDTFLSHNDVVSEVVIECSFDEKVKLVQYAIDMCGKPYGFKQLIGIALGYINNKLNLSFFQDKSEGFTCSELVYIVLKDILKEVMPELNQDFVTPKDIYLILKEKTNA